MYQLDPAIGTIFNQSPVKYRFFSKNSGLLTYYIDFTGSFDILTMCIWNPNKRIGQW